tara:strand:+ start:43 stop:654 length:612 start_codon:yes stop_codon:yes gene_type:complete
MAYGTLNAGAITPGSGNTLTLSESIVLGTVTAGNLSNTAIVYPVGHILGSACLVRVLNGNDGASTTSKSLRTLDTVLYEIGFGVTISSNEWTFDNAGSYLISASAPAYNSTRNICFLYSGTGSTLEATGTSEFSENGSATQTRSFLYTKLVVSDAQKTGGGSVKTFGMYSITSVAVAANGFGPDSSASTVEQFTQVQIFKIQE